MVLIHGTLNAISDIMTLLNFVRQRRMRLCFPGRVDEHNIFIRHRVTQTDSLRNMSRTGTPYQRILERILESPVNAITYIFYSAVTAHNQSLAKIGLCTLALGVDADQLEFLPASVDDILNTQVVPQKWQSCCVKKRHNSYSAGASQPNTGTL